MFQILCKKGSVENGILIDKVSVIQKHIHVLQNFAKCSG